MKLWTNHPKVLAIDKIAQIDPTKGFWWRYDEPGFRYRDVFPVLSEKLKARHFLWCASCQGEYYRTPEQSDLLEWELDVPRSSVLEFYDEGVWDKIVHGKSDDWTTLFAKEIEDPIPKHIGALVRLPLPPNTATCLGPSPAVTIYDKDGKVLVF